MINTQAAHLLNRSKHAGSIYRQGLPYIDTTRIAAPETPLQTHFFYTNPDSKWAKSVRDTFRTDGPSGRGAVHEVSAGELLGTAPDQQSPAQEHFSCTTWTGKQHWTPCGFLDKLPPHLWYLLYSLQSFIFKTVFFADSPQLEGC